MKCSIENKFMKPKLYKYNGNKYFQYHNIYYFSLILVIRSVIVNKTTHMVFLARILGILYFDTPILYNG